MKGVFLDLQTVDNGDLDLERLRAALSEWRFERLGPEDPAAACIGDAEVVVSNKVRLDAAVMEAASGVRLVCIAATGTNNIDLDAARARGITVCNVPCYATPSVVQHVFALILALSTHLCDYRRTVAGGRWQSARQFCLLDYPVTEIAGRTLGIVGYGEIGRAVARVAEAFGMGVRVAAHTGRPDEPGRVTLETLLAAVDVLSLHVPLTPRTRGLIGAAELARMKPGALLINTARGGIVDEAALAHALRNGRLGGAGIDVLNEEPPLHGSPLLDPDIPNLIVTPHTAWSSREARQRLVDGVAGNIHAYLEGRPRNVAS